jgi:hypothetical protein
MQSPSLVADYLDTLTRELSFDAALSRRVRREVEDHLCEAAAAAAQRGDGVIEAQRRAIAAFGDPRDIARGYAAPSLFRHTRRVGGTSILVVAGIFMAMKLRLAWFGPSPPIPNGARLMIREVALAIDLYSFKLALAATVLGAVYLACRRFPASFHRAYGRELNRYFVLCLVVTGALIASVLSDAVLVGLRLSATAAQPSPLVLVLLMAIEIAFAGALALHLRRAFRRMASVAALYRNAVIELRDDT